MYAKKFQLDSLPKRMFSQLFGDPCDTSNEGNIFSALEFNADGDFLASGDRGGRVVVYERNKNSPQKVMLQIPWLIPQIVW